MSEADIEPFKHAGSQILGVLAIDLKPAENFCLPNNKPLFGWAPETAQIDDYLCVVHGVKVPMVMRKNDDQHFVFVGQAYVHGIMDGEAIQSDSLTDEIISVI